MNCRLYSVIYGGMEASMFIWRCTPLLGKGEAEDLQVWAPLNSALGELVNESAHAAPLRADADSNAERRFRRIWAFK